jgi:hypothetical protein
MEFSMQQDISAVMFNRNHKAQAAAREAAIGVRLLLAALLMDVVAIGVALATQTISPGEPGLFAIPILVLTVLSFGCGAYGTYALMVALGWTWAFAIPVILGLLIPYAKLIVLVLLAARCLWLIDKSGLRFRLFGTLQQKTPARAAN